MNERKKRITSSVSEEFLQPIKKLDIRVEPANVFGDAKTLPVLTRKYGLTAYDAVYLELAKRKSLPLATLDKDLLKAATSKGVALLQHP